MDLKQKRVLVTGACGTVGRELIRQLLEQQQTGELIALDNNESELFASNTNLPNTIRQISSWPMSATATGYTTK